jgi:hypothetical protein
MRRTLSIFAFLGLVQLAFGALAAERATINRRTGLFEPPVSDLRKAAERGDRAELSRAATRLGPARLARLLADPDRRTVLAALEAAPLVNGGVVLLDPMLPLFASPDEGVRARVVTAIAALFAQVDPGRLADYEVAPETVLATCQALAGVATTETEKLSARLSAIQGLVDAGGACPNQRKVDVLLASREPEIRRAAVLALPEGGEAMAPLLAASKDRDGRVAGAAAARLCKHGTKRAALPPLLDLVVAETALTEDVLDLLPCLVGSSDPADQKALAKLAETGRPPIREAIAHLRETRPSRPVAESPAKKP